MATKGWGKVGVFKSLAVLRLLWSTLLTRVTPTLATVTLSSQNLEDDDVPPSQSKILAVPCEQAIAVLPLTLDAISIRSCDRTDVSGRKSVLESSNLAPEPR